MGRVVDQHVLVLNRNWQPVTFLRVGVAIATCVRDMAWVLHPETYELLEWDRWCEAAPAESRQVPTPSGTIPAPDAVVLRAYERLPQRGVSFSRHALSRRDGHRCQYCGVGLVPDQVTIDHVLPRSRGGPTTWENCVVACGRCNGLKADRTPQEAGLRLRATPRRPAWRPRVSARTRQVRPAWEPFLGKGGVEVEVTDG